MRPALPDDLEERLAGREPVRPASPPPRRAAVATILRRDGGSDRVLLITRREHDEDPWSGHVSFPGGMRDPVDDGLLATALRETREEVGLDLARGARLLARLDPVTAIGRGRALPMDITPFVFRLESRAEPEPGHEASEAFWLPLEPVVAGDLDDVFPHPFAGTERMLPCWRWEGRVIWGLTYRMLRDVLVASGASR